MGNSDYLIFKQQQSFIDFLIKNGYILNDDQQISKIAHLGNRNDNETVSYCRQKFPNAQHVLYDIELKNWDINKEWGIEGYDLIICYRTTSFAESLEFFLEQLKKCISKNKNVIFDFALYGPRRIPMNLNAKFDFRNLFKPPPDWGDSDTWQACNQDYYDATMHDSFTEETLKKNNIIPRVTTSKCNEFKKDVHTYMYWGSQGTKK